MTVKLYAAALAVLSAVAFAAYAADKGKAKRGAWRIPERVLLGLSFFGGAVGGYAAMFVCRHKTRKAYFHLVNLAGLLWQAGLFVFLLIRGV